MNLENLPDILKAEHLIDFLDMSRSKVYGLMRIKKEAGGIPAVRIGRNVRVLKHDLIEWLDNQKEA